VLSASQRDAFDRTGIVKLPGAFSAADAARMCDVVWDELQRRHGLDRHDPSTWDRHPPTGLKGSKKHSAFAPIFGAALCGALDDLLGPAAWIRPKHYGQVLVTMPNAATWSLPHALWHTDFQYALTSEPLPAVKYWALIDDVEPGGGGTPQLAGSHHAIARYIDGLTGDALEYKRVRDGFLRSHAWLRALSGRGDEPDRSERLMSTPGDVDGLALQAVELTGSAGDIYLTHPWVMHTIAPNAATRPRMMRSMAVWRADALS
jgi:phytanoyl-CoA dioxygenase PhyH